MRYQQELHCRTAAFPVRPAGLSKRKDLARREDRQQPRPRRMLQGDITLRKQGPARRGCLESSAEQTGQYQTSTSLD